MLIRSQDKRYSVNANNVIVETLDDEIICYHLADLATNNYIVLGHYATEEKASKVSDMIHEAYSDFEASKTICTGLVSAVYTGSYDNLESITEALKGYATLVKEATVFQMPEDSEVEV